MNAMSAGHLEYEELSSLEPTMRSLELDGTWKILERTIEDGARENAQGLYHVVKKC